jgi:hypothetical protein
MRFAIHSQILLRIIDDFLFVTADESKAQRFFARMINGHTEYGCQTAPEKTLVNFEIDAAQAVKPAMCESSGGCMGPRKL